MASLGHNESTTIWGKLSRRIKRNAIQIRDDDFELISININIFFMQEYPQNITI